MSDPPLRRSKSLKTTHVLKSRKDQRDGDVKGDGAQLVSSVSETVQLRPKAKKKRKRDTIRKRISLVISSDKTKDEEVEKAARRISIGENVSFSHKEHVGKDEANQFLLRLLKLREERYMEMHQNIRENISRGYMYLRPPNHMINRFEEIIPRESLRRRVC